MTCSELNFVSSQHFYGLCIAKGAELPSLKDGDAEWMTALARLNRLAIQSSKHQIKTNLPAKQRKARRGRN